MSVERFFEAQGPYGGHAKDCAGLSNEAAPCTCNFDDTTIEIENEDTMEDLYEEQKEDDFENWDGELKKAFHTSIEKMECE